SNWQLSGTIHLQSGFPYTIEGNTSILGAIKADYVGGPVLLPNPGPNGWINKAAFKVAPDTRFGTAGAGDVRGPGLQTYNVSVARLFPILREGTTLQFRADFLNAFNTVNFQPFPSSSLNVSDATFGTLTSAYPARTIQLSMKLRF
ncbi:MAG: hypothetical protein JOZ62_19940, partial [Acidobacteriaceae bacterium]|nr:hypothetical protein [Acidobacteriaceae bacterium]